MRAVDSEDAAVEGVAVGGWGGGAATVRAQWRHASRARAKTRRCHIGRDGGHIKMHAAAEWLAE